MEWSHTNSSNRPSWLAKPRFAPTCRYSAHCTVVRQEFELDDPVQILLYQVPDIGRRLVAGTRGPRRQAKISLALTAHTNWAALPVSPGSRNRCRYRKIWIGVESAPTAPASWVSAMICRFYASLHRRYRHPTDPPTAARGLPRQSTSAKCPSKVTIRRRPRGISG